jgi:hypothetical protein
MSTVLSSQKESDVYCATEEGGKKGGKQNKNWEQPRILFIENQVT